MLFFAGNHGGLFGDVTRCATGDIPFLNCTALFDLCIKFLNHEVSTVPMNKLAFP